MKRWALALALTAALCACSSESDQAKAEKYARYCQASLDLGLIEAAGDLEEAEHQPAEEAVWVHPYDEGWTITSWYRTPGGERTWYVCTIAYGDIIEWAPL